MSKNRQKKNRKRTANDDPEAELRKGLREHEKLHSERTSTDDYREYGTKDEEDGQE